MWFHGSNWCILLPMDQAIYLIIFFVILILGIGFYTQWSNTQTADSEHISNKDVKSHTNKKFSFENHLSCSIHIIRVGFVVVVVGFAIGLVVLSWFLITSYPQWMLSGKEYIVLSTNPYALYLLLLAFFPGIILGALLLTSLNRIFPGLIHYFEQNQQKQLRAKVNSNSTRKQYLKFTIILSVIIVLILALAADNYYYVDKYALHYNSFLGITEKSISLKNLQKIEVGAWQNNGRTSSGLGINWKYILVFNAGEKFNLKEAYTSDLKDLDTYLMEKNIPVEVTLSYGAMTSIDTYSSQDLRDLFAQVLNRAVIRASSTRYPLIQSLGKLIYNELTNF